MCAVVRRCCSGRNVDKKKETHSSRWTGTILACEMQGSIHQIDSEQALTYLLCFMRLQLQTPRSMAIGIQRIDRFEQNSLILSQNSASEMVADFTSVPCWMVQSIIEIVAGAQPFWMASSR